MRKWTSIPGTDGQIKSFWDLLMFSLSLRSRPDRVLAAGCQMSAWESLVKLIWFTSCVDEATQMICLSMAVINHRQPEGTASMHGKESGVAHHSSHRACVCRCGHVRTHCTNVYCKCVCVCSVKNECVLAECVFHYVSGWGFIACICIWV